MRKPPTVPLYIRIPPDLRARLDAVSGTDPKRPWIVHRLQDIVIEALYRAFPEPPDPETIPPAVQRTDVREPAAATTTTTPARTRKRSPGKSRRSRGSAAAAA